MQDIAHAHDAPALAGRRGRRKGPPRPIAPPIVLSPGACRRRRQALGLTPYALAQAAGLQELTVLRYEAAAVRPRPVTVVALHNALRRLEAARVPTA